jgi:preprotein translocase subunit SecD
VAPPAGTLRVGRYFSALIALIAVLYLVVFWPGSRHTPKLGLDLQGGTQVIFTAKTTDGKTPSHAAMEQAKQIMTNRVNGSGVTEATVVIQGNDQLVVSVPKSTTTDVAKLGTTARLNFRGLVAPVAAVTCASPSAAASATPSPGATTTGTASPTASPAAAASTPAAASASPTGTAASPQVAHARPLQANSTSPSAPKSAAKAAATGTATPSATPSPAATSTAPAVPCTATPFAALEASGVKIPLTETEWDALGATNQAAITKAMGNFDCSSAQDEKDVADSYYLACDPSGTYVYLLGPVIVPGTEISSASAVAPSTSTGGTPEWTVSLGLKSSGQAAWAKYTAAHNIGGASPSGTNNVTNCGTAGGGYPCANYVGFTLDGQVLSAPVNIQAINGGDTQISGGFTQGSAKALADQLKYGALPLNFKAEQALTVSATLGSTQLKYGLIAGGIGLILVVLYSLLYYRLLGLVTISSLVVSGILIYASLVILGAQIDFTLSLAGIAGFIVAIGITADSFVVFFERLKDEIHEGRSARVAVPRAWTRARRTILSADLVSFLAAAILYYFAAGDVRGFAFTLGLSTILDIAVVFLFTHPLVSYLSRFRLFGTKAFTGLDAVRVATPAGVILTDEEAEAVSVNVQATADAEAISADERAAARRARLRAQREEGEV